MHNNLQVRTLIFLTCCLCFLFLVGFQTTSPSKAKAYRQASDFALSSSMLAYEPDKAKKFVDKYMAQCGDEGRLDEKFYKDAFKIATDIEMFDLSSTDEAKKFVEDFALSCKPRALFTPAFYKRAKDIYTDNGTAMEKSDKDLWAFIWDIMMKCAKENYLTHSNWNRVYNYAHSVDGLNMGHYEARDYTIKFFRECRTDFPTSK